MLCLYSHPYILEEKKLKSKIIFTLFIIIDKKLQVFVQKFTSYL